MHFSTWRWLGVLGLVIAGGTHAAEDPSGDPDPSFNGTGHVVSNVTTRATYSDAGGTVVQADGRIVVAGSYDAGGGLTHVSLTRYNADGSVDAAFGNGGEVKTSVGSYDLTFGVALQSDGKIIVVGSANTGTAEDFFAARYTTGGVLDSTFGVGGIRTVEVGVNLTGVPVFDRAQAVVVQSDDKIVIAGYSDNVTVATNNGRDFAFARLTANGALDSGFGSGGKLLVHFAVSTSTAERALAVTLQSDGKIVAAGRGTSTQIGVVRLNTNGTVDTTFASSGYFLGSYPGGGGADRFQALRVDSAGRIVGAGMFFGSKFQMLVGRLTSAGALDTSFDGDGYASTSILGASGQDQCRAVSVQSDNKIVCSGMADADNAGLFKMFAARFNVNGSLDTTFNGTGKFSIDASGTGQQNDARAGALQSDGKYLMVGTSYPSGTATATQISAIRLTTAGVLDTSFDGDGIVFRQLLGGSPDYGYGVAVQGDNKVVVVGSTADASSGNLVIARYTAAGVLDAGFGTAGQTITGVATYNEIGRAVLIQPDNSIIVGGDRSPVTPPAPAYQLLVAKYTSGGVLDGTFGTGGIATAPLDSNGGAGYAIARQTDGKILLAGSITNVSSNWDFVVARFSSAGVLDAGFGTAGVARINVTAGAVDEAKVVRVQSDGKILLGGYVTAGPATEFAMVRLTTAGALDASFGTAGVVRTPIGAGGFPRNSIEGLAILPDGRIIAGGTGNDGFAASNPLFRLARYNSNGTLDNSYGSGGIVSYNFDAMRFDNMAALSLQYDEKVVAFGQSTLLPGGNIDYALARFNWDDGSIDPTYGTNGQVIAPLSAGLDAGYDGVLMADGRQVMTGVAQQADLGTARFLGDPAPILPAVPDMTAASDTGASSTDNITKNNTPTFTGTCNTGDTVWLKVDNVTLAPAVRNICRSGTYSLTLTSALADGVHTAAVFSRNGAGDTGTTGTLSYTIDTVAAAVSIAAPTAAANILPNPGISGGGAESGASVTVKESAATVCTATANASGNWSCSSTLGQGQHTVDVTQTDIAGNTSTPTSRTFRIKLATSAAAQTTLSPSVFGQSVTFTATISASGGTPDGNVNFVIDGGSPQPAALVGGSATLVSSSLAVGAHTVNVDYPETLGYFTSNSSLAGGQTVNKASTQTVLASTPANLLEGQTVTLAATLSVVAPGGGTVDGSVNFLVDGSTAAGCAAVAVSSSAASCGPLTLAVGVHTLQANYAGTSSYNASGSGTPASLTMHPSAPAAPLLATSSDSGISNADNITNVVAPEILGSCVTGDTIQLRDGVAPVGGVLPCSGAAYNVFLGLSEAVHTLTATATRNSVESAASGSLVLTIDRSVAAPQISGPATPVVDHPDLNGTGEAGAEVKVYETQNVVCTATVGVGGTWSCSTSIEGPGQHTLQAEQTDLAGNTSTLSPNFIVELDRIFLGTFGP